MARRDLTVQTHTLGARSHSGKSLCCLPLWEVGRASSKSIGKDWAILSGGTKNTKTNFIECGPWSRFATVYKGRWAAPPTNPKSPPCAMDCGELSSDDKQFQDLKMTTSGQHRRSTATDSLTPSQRRHSSEAAHPGTKRDPEPTEDRSATVVPGLCCHLARSSTNSALPLAAGAFFYFFGLAFRHG